MLVETTESIYRQKNTTETDDVNEQVAEPPVVEYFNEYKSKGWMPIPIPPDLRGNPRKFPTEDDWQLKALADGYTAADFLEPNTNMGILLGRPNNLADVDLDSATARKIGAKVLAPYPTLCFGRSGSPRSHFFYYLDKPSKSYEIKDPVKMGLKSNHKSVIEIRCLKNDLTPGLQTVVPPSIHQGTLEDIRFEEDSLDEPAFIEFDKLYAAYKLIGVASLLADYVQVPGDYNEAHMALGGFFSHHGVPFEQAKEMFLLSFQHSTGYDGNDAKALGRLEASYKLFAEDSDAPMKGRPTLETIIDRVTGSEGKGRLVMNVMCEVLGLAKKSTENKNSADGTTSSDVSRVLQILDKSRLSTLEIPPIEYLQEPFLIKKTVTCFWGSPGHGKSTFIMQMLHELAETRDDLKIIWCDPDNPTAFAKERSERLRGVLPDKISYWGGETKDADGNILRPWKIDDIRWLALIKEVTQAGQHVIIVFDTLNSFMDGQDENSNSVMGFFLNRFRDMQHAGATVIPIHHAGKDVKAGPRGGSAFTGGCDVSWFVDAALTFDNKIDTLTLTTNKTRKGGTKPQKFKMNPDGRLESMSFNNRKVAQESAAFEFICKHLGKSSNSIEQEGMKANPKFARQLIRDTIDKNLMAGKLVRLNQKIQLKGTPTQVIKACRSETDMIDTGLFERLAQEVA